jgi:transposase
MIHEIQRLKDLGLSKRMIAKALGCSRNTVDKYLSSTADTASETSKEYKAPWSDTVNWPDVESATSRGMAVSLYWEQKIATHEALQHVPYVSFWREYRRRFPNIPIELHKLHPPAERCEIDYKGDAAGLGYIDRQTREYVPCRLFGAILCFSQLFFPRATLSEKQDDLLGSVAAAYRYFGGVPLTSALDNAKAAVHKAHRYDPDINREFAHFCDHFGTAPLAMRPGQPKDKNLIENILGVFWRWARQGIQERTFHSLTDLNDFLHDLAEEFNHRIQRKYGVSRKAKFDLGEREKLLPLPTAPYSVGEWKTAKPHPDCHVQVGKNFYSIPYELRDRTVDVRVTPTLVEIYRDLDCVARHIKCFGNTIGQYITNESHLPEAHRALREATPRQALEQAEQIGPATGKIIKNLIEKPRHPLAYLRRCQGILRLAKRYSGQALERACSTLLSIGAETPRLSDVENIIKAKAGTEPGNVIPIKRQQNPFLRGQDSWRLQ